jgi:hypothetical protein
LRNFVEMQRSQPAVDEEQFRFITGFNDIFVHRRGDPAGRSRLDRPVDRYVYAGLAVEVDGPSFLAPAAVAAASWGLALFFTARRRMALPSILLLLAFVGAVFAASGFALVWVSAPRRLDDNASSWPG